MEPAEVNNDKVTSLLGTWVRVVLTDKRAFVGSLKAIDDSCNVVLMNAVEVRPMTHRPGEEERKGHRGFVMIKAGDIVSVGRRVAPMEEPPKQGEKEEEPV